MKRILAGIAFFLSALLLPAMAGPIDPAFAPYMPVDACPSRDAPPPCIPPADYPHEVHHGDFMVTSPEADADAPMLPNFWVRTDRRYRGFGTPYDWEGSPKVYMRGGNVIIDKDDSPEIAFRSYHKTADGPRRIIGGTILGRIYAQPWAECPGVGMGGGWYDPCETGEKVSNRAVDLMFRENADSSGDVQIHIKRAAQGNATPALRFYAAEPTGVQTPIGVWVNGQGGTVFRRVEVGPNNGCGTGYACLRIPNR